MAKTNTTSPSNEGNEKANQHSTTVAGKVDANTAPNPETPTESTPTADAQITKNDGDEVPTVKTVFDGIEIPELQDRGLAIIGLDKLLVQNEARGTIYELALGLHAKQVKVTLKAKRLKGKKFKAAFDGYIGSLKLSSARSTRTIERYMQVVQEMTDDETLSENVKNALKAAEFTDDLKTEVLALTNGMGITKLYEKYGMVSEKPPKVKVDKSIEDRLMDEVISLINTHKKLTKIRAELVGAGEAIDPSLDEIIGKTSDALITLSKHPVIAAMLKKLEEEQKASKEAKS